MRVPDRDIARQSRHGSLANLDGYIRIIELWTSNAASVHGNRFKPKQHNNATATSPNPSKGPAAGYRTRTDHYQTPFTGTSGPGCRCTSSAQMFVLPDCRTMVLHGLRRAPSDTSLRSAAR